MNLKIKQIGKQGEMKIIFGLVMKSLILDHNIDCQNTKFAKLKPAHMRFSQRIGKSTIRESLQLEGIDSTLENLLWNNILVHFLYNTDDTNYHRTKSERHYYCTIIWTEFLKQRVDEVSHDSRKIIDSFKEWFFKSEWYEKYDLIEFISLLAPSNLKLNFDKFCNESLRKEMSAYRLLNSKIIQITSEEEIIEIESAVNSPISWGPVTKHLTSAITLFSNRENPDYRNTIKESISAVEALCIIIVNDPSATLGEALIKIEKKYKIHKAMKSAFSSLYGYSSDSGGIRHSLLEDDIEVTFEDAKFMLVSCSAFINYLKTKVHA